jgi:NADP-dependent 3-hydroxy acid dehydrogenase YdfG
MAETAEQIKVEPGAAYEPESIAGKSILITGGTTGIGRAAALMLAAAGAKVMIFGRHEPELNDAMNDLRQTGGDVFGITADVSKKEDIAKIFQEADERLGGLDVLINNAALGAESITGGAYEDWEYIVGTNLLGYMACAHEAIDRMRKRGGGHIVNVGSMSADVREKGSSIYVATKAGIQGFSEALRKEVNGEGIKVSLIEPGLVGTNMTREKAENQEEEARALKMLKAEDIAAAIYYCLIQPKRCDVVVVQIRPHLQEI